MNLRERIYLNDNWGYTVEYKEELLSKDFDVPLEQVRLPHTTVETPFHYFDESIYQIRNLKKIRDEIIDEINSYRAYLKGGEWKSRIQAVFWI